MTDTPLDHAWTVIMAGGVGSRFWPLSRAARPKQLLDLFGDGSMLRATFERLEPVVPPERQIVVTGRILGDAVREALPEVPPANVLEEPTGRNTAPAIGWAALEVRRRDPDAILAVLPADQHIVDTDAYRRVVRRAVEAAAEGRIVTLGIPATRPETGYGYIRAGETIDGEVRGVREFKEKPDRETALRYLKEGGYLWNAGMFFMPADLGVSELRRHEPDLAEGLDSLFEGDAPPTRERLSSVYPTLKSISVDYAVMERSDRVAVIPGDFGWSDVGSWRSLWDFRPEGEPSFTRGRVIEIDGGDNVLFADEGTVATVGVRDLVVVHTRDATLVCPRAEAQRVKDIVKTLEEQHQEDLL
ncbi:MAG: mannose-1-phosphate guanylyltransferase [Myxococcota bacterium]